MRDFDRHLATSKKSFHEIETFFFPGFTQEQFDQVLAKVVPYSIYIGLFSLGFVVADSITHSMWSSKGTSNKILNTLTTLVYTVIVSFLFAISIVSLWHSSAVPRGLPIQVK